MTQVSDVFVPSGWMGDFQGIELDATYTGDFRSAPASIRVSWRSGPQGWAGIYWQYPENNWGEKPGHNLQGATRLTFWAKGATGGEVVEFKMGGIRAGGASYHDSADASLGFVTLVGEWRQFSIELRGKDLSNVIGGFAWIARSTDNPSGLTFFVDDIAYEGIGIVR